MRLRSRVMLVRIRPGLALMRFMHAGAAELKRAVDEKRKADAVKLAAGCRMNVRIPMYSPDLTRNKTNTQKKN